MRDSGAAGADSPVAAAADHQAPATDEETSAEHEAEASPEVDPRVVQALETWRQELLELAGGSALWDIDSLGDAVIELTGAHPSGIAQLYAGRRTRLSNVVREGASLSLARRQARVVLARADDLAEQFGVAPTYVAMGVARWFMADDPTRVRSALDLHEPEGRTVQVPVLLRPIRMHPFAGNDIDMELDPQVEVNPVLVRALRLHGVQVDPAILAASTKREHGFTPRPALDAIQALGGALPEFALESRIVVGTFVHPGQALAEDLDAQREALLSHGVVQMLAGAADNGETASRKLPSKRLADPDPDAERGIGDLDSAQHQILDAFASGSNLLIDTPPGVDAAGTVAALIAEVARAGANLLYVPGTRRAGAAVRDALRRVGAEDLVLDLSTDPQWRKTAALHLVEGLNPPLPDSPDGVVQSREALKRARKVLGDFIGALHLPRDPWGVSANRVLHELADLTSQRPGPRTQVRIPSQTLRELTSEEQAEARGLLIRAGELGAFRLRASDTPWYGAVLADADHARASLTHVQTLADSLPTVAEQIAATAAQSGVDEAKTLAQWEEQLELLDGISDALDVFTSEVFERPAADMVAATASKKWRAEREISLPRSAIRRLRKQAKDLVRPGVVVGDLHGQLAKVAELREVWRRHCSGGGWPRVPENLREITETYGDVARSIGELDDVLAATTAGRELREVPLGELIAKFTRLAGDEATLHTMPERAQTVANLGALGLEALLEDLTSRRVHTDTLGAEFDLAWWSSVLEEMLSEDPAMVALDPGVLETGLEDLRASDHAHVASLLAPILNAHGQHMRTAISEHRSEAQEFYRAVKQRGEVDLRHLMADYPNIAWRPRPAWIIPPMVIPQALPPNVQADVVILDAVHRLGVEYLLPAIARGAQIMVVADSQRPGSAMVEACADFPRIALPADRVDRAAPLANFLSEHGYADSIQPVPSPPQVESDVVRLDLVDGVGMPAPDSEVVESVQVEVDQVVDLVIDHALSRPEESLAVIALNTRHADRVREALAQVVHDSPALTTFFDTARSEAFTIVSIDAAAGLRRDAVLLTLGYGKTPHGRVLHRFGAISGPHGAGLLVDAIDAAKKRLTVVSSFSAGELDPHRLRSEGAQMLAELLEFAARGFQPVGGQAEEEAEPDRLLVDLAERLWRLGITVVPQYGRPGWFRIPLALGHPSRPDELLLAVLTDDTAYTTETSLRRRDRHWPERLIQRGWHVRTVFSTAVFMDPQGEAERIAAEVLSLAQPEREEPAAHTPMPPKVALDGAEDLLTQAETQSQAPAPVRVSARGETIAGQTTRAIPLVVTPGERAPRPDIEAGRPFSGYSDDQLDALVAWLGSDGKARTVEQYVLELRTELGLTRKSAHVDRALAAAVTRSDAPVFEAEPNSGEPSPAGEQLAIGATPPEAQRPGEGAPASHEQPGLFDPGAPSEDAGDVPPPQGARKRKPRRATRAGTEDPEFQESSWRGEERDQGGEPGNGSASEEGSDADDERILREKPPHW